MTTQSIFVISSLFVRQMKRFYRYNLNHPRYCDDLLPSIERKVLCAEILIPLPERSSDGCRLLMINAGRKWTPKTISIDEIFRAIMLSLVAAMAEPKTQVCRQQEKQELWKFCSLKIRKNIFNLRLPSDRSLVYTCFSTWKASR